MFEILFDSPIILKHGERIFTNDKKQFIAPLSQLLQPVVADYSIFALVGSRYRRERQLLIPQQLTTMFWDCI